MAEAFPLAALTECDWYGNTSFPYHVGIKGYDHTIEMRIVNHEAVHHGIDVRRENIRIGGSQSSKIEGRHLSFGKQFVCMFKKIVEVACGYLVCHHKELLLAVFQGYAVAYGEYGKERKQYWQRHLYF